MSLANLLRSAQGASAQPRKADEILAALPHDLKVALVKPPIMVRLEAYVTSDPPSLDMLRRARMCAFRTEPVLIRGETGTGKELVAKIMLGGRPLYPDTPHFFAQNCAGIVDTLFESLIFGHVTGAFTGATGDRPGLLAAAKDGVVFFDEIGELPIAQQAKLLRALQERAVTPVGSTREVPIKCRMVFATHRNLEAMVAAGTFREDLYYRISALELETIPLRLRPDDAGIIAQAICNARGWDMPDDIIPDSIIQSPGNVRALEKWLLKKIVFGD